MKKFAVILFDTAEEMLEFQSDHKELELYDHVTKEFLVVETEKNEIPEYKKRIVARYMSPDNKLLISSMKRYKMLSDNAKRIIDCIKEPKEGTIILQVGKSFNGINIDKNLYYEIFHFAQDRGLNYCRYNVEDGEQIEICLNIDGIVRLQ